MDVTTILQLQDTLEKQAHTVLDQLGIISILSEYETPQIVGSLALRVMTRKDIDLEIINNELGRQELSSIVQKLAENPLPRLDFTIMDNSDNKTATLPQGFYIGIKYTRNDIIIEKYRDNPEVWQIDVWIFREEFAQASRVTKELAEKMTPEKRSTILEIKYALSQSPDYKKKFSGIDIYKAVLEKNVTSKEQFLELFT